MAEAYEFDPEDPRVKAGLDKIDDAIMDIVHAVYEDEEVTAMMPVCWGIGVELVGYSRDGKRYRRMEALFPPGQGFSATRGVLETASEGVVDSFFDPTDTED